VTPNQCGSWRWNATGTGPVSFGGSSARTVAPEATRTPHAWQNRAPGWSATPQFGQESATGADALMRGLCPRLECP
jgi:hypothetical protein